MAIGVIELLGATLLITNVTNEPVPIPLVISPITPVFKLEPIPPKALDDLRLTLVVLDLRLTIVLLRVDALLKGIDFRLVVTDLRLRVGVFLTVLAFFLPNAILFKNAAFFAPFSLATCN